MVMNASKFSAAKLTGVYHIISWLALRYFEELASRPQYLVAMKSGSMLLVTLTAFTDLKLSDLLPILRNPRLRRATNHLITTLSATALIDTACTTLTRAFHKLLGNFLATFRISSKFFRFEQLLALWAISSFLQILRDLSERLSLPWPCLHISQCFEFSRKFLNSGAENWRKIHAAGLPDQRFFKENIKMAGNDAHTLYWFESFRWRRSFRSFEGSGRGKTEYSCISHAVIYWQQAKCLILMSYMSFLSSFLKLPIVLVEGGIVLCLTAFLYPAGLAKVKLRKDESSGSRHVWTRNISANDWELAWGLNVVIPLFIIFSLLFPSFNCGKEELFSSARSRTVLAVLIGFLAS